MSQKQLNRYGSSHYLSKKRYSQRPNVVDAAKDREERGEERKKKTVTKANQKKEENERRRQREEAKERVKVDSRAKTFAENFLESAPPPPAWTGSDRHGLKHSRSAQRLNPRVGTVLSGTVLSDTDDFFYIGAKGITKRKRRKPRKKKSLNKRKETSKKKRVRRKRKSMRRS